MNTFEANSSPFNPFLNPIPDEFTDPTPARDENPFKAGVQKGNETTLDNQLRGTSYRLVQELGNRRSFYDFDYFRYVLGLNGNFNIKDNDFINQLGYDTGFVYERQDNIQTDSGDAKRSVIVDAIDGLDVDGDGVEETFFNPFIGQSAPVTGTATTYVNGVPTGTLAYDNQAAVTAASFVARTYFYQRDHLYDAKVFEIFSRDCIREASGSTWVTSIGRATSRNTPIRRKKLATSSDSTPTPVSTSARKWTRSSVS